MLKLIGMIVILLSYGGMVRNTEDTMEAKQISYGAIALGAVAYTALAIHETPITIIVSPCDSVDTF